MVAENEASDTARNEALAKAIQLVRASGYAVFPHPRIFNNGSLGALSPRERDIFGRLGEGSSLKMIAAQLGISPKTVEYHRQQIKERLGVSSSAELARMATLCFVLYGSDRD